MTNSISEIRDARVIFVIGSNTTEQHPMIGMHMLEAKDRGATLIVADPRRTQIAQFSHLHLRHKSGTDVALLNAIMNVIITEWLVDLSFIRQRTEDQLNSLPVSVLTARRLFGVSLHPQMTEEENAYIAAALWDAVERLR